MSIIKYKNKYRTSSTRLPNWDYSNKGGYFITICTKNRENYFGEIDKDEMKLSKVGEVALNYWKGIVDHYSFCLIGKHIEMPNHIHGVLFIEGVRRTIVRLCRKE